MCILNPLYSCLCIHTLRTSQEFLTRYDRYKNSRRFKIHNIVHYKKFFGGNNGNKQITFFFYHKSVKYNRAKVNLITSSSGSRFSLIVLDLFIKSFNLSSFTCLHNGRVFLPRYVEYMYISLTIQFSPLDQL